MVLEEFGRFKDSRILLIFGGLEFFFFFFMLKIYGEFQKTVCGFSNSYDTIECVVTHALTCTSFQIQLFSWRKKGTRVLCNNVCE